MYPKCPKCGSVKTHRSRTRPGERTTATVFMRPMRCRDCKERFWIQNRGAYVAAAAIVFGIAAFLGLIWLVVMHAARNQDIALRAPTGEQTVAGIPTVASVYGDLQADISAANEELKSVEKQAGDRRALLKTADDQAVTVQWYRESAAKGDLDAQYKLGLLHLTGKGALQDFAEAARWLTLAAEQGHALAQYHLGLIYRVGHGVQTDQAEAYKWLNLAAAGGVNEAVVVRNEVMRSLPAEQLARAQKASRDWQANRAKTKPAAEQKQAQTDEAAAPPEQAAQSEAEPTPTAKSVAEAPQKKAALNPSARPGKPPGAESAPEATRKN